MTTIERLLAAKDKHSITERDLSFRTATDEDIPLYVAQALVAKFLDKRSCALVVAAALISLIVEKSRINDR